MTLRLPGQHGDSLIVQHIAAVVDQTVLSVAGVGIEGDVGHHAKLGKFLFQNCHRARRQAILVVRLARIQSFQRRIDHRKQCHHRDTQLDAFLGIFQQQVKGLALYPRHGLDILHPVCPLEYEDRVDKICRSEYVLSH